MVGTKFAEQYKRYEQENCGRKLNKAGKIGTTLCDKGRLCIKCTKFKIRLEIIELSNVNDDGETYFWKEHWTVLTQAPFDEILHEKRLEQLGSGFEYQ